MLMNDSIVRESKPRCDLTALTLTKTDPAHIELFTDLFIDPCCDWDIFAVGIDLLKVAPTFAVKEPEYH